MPLVPLEDGMRVVFEAIDPLTGAPVAGVVIGGGILTVESDAPIQAPEFKPAPVILAYSETNG